MEPPLKSRFPGLTCHPLQLARSGGSLFAPNRRAPLIVNLRFRRNGDNLRAVRQIPLRAQRRSGPGYAMFPRSPSPGPVWANASPAPERCARLGASVTRPCSLSSRPVTTGDGRRFPTASGFGRFPPFAGERKTLTNP